MSVIPNLLTIKCNLTRLQAILFKMREDDCIEKICGSVKISDLILEKAHVEKSRMRPPRDGETATCRVATLETRHSLHFDFMRILHVLNVYLSCLIFI